MADTVLEISNKIKKIIQTPHTNSQTTPPNYHSPTPKLIIHSYFPS